MDSAAQRLARWYDNGSTSCLVLDGALGTELLRRGLDTRLPLWSARALLTEPEAVTAIHADYVRAGADVLTANTFRTNRRAFERAGRSASEARAATVQAVACARRAIAAAATAAVSKPAALVAGSLAPLEDCYRPDLVPDPLELAREHRELVDWLVEAGVDLLLVETMNTRREAEAAVAAAAASGLRVWASFVLGDAPDRLLSGEPLAEAARAAAGAGASAIGVNCGPPAQIQAALETLSAAVPLIQIAYANGGRVGADGGRWDFDPAMDAQRYSDWAARWLDAGVRVVGGCCGTGPDQIARIRSNVDKRNQAA